MKADLEKRTAELERSRVYRIRTVADYAVLRARLRRGDQLPESIEVDPAVMELFSEEPA